MIAKKYKLPIQLFLSEKPIKVLHSDFFVLKLFKTELQYSRFGLVITKKISGRAVDRNAIKRAIFDFLRLCQQELRALDYLFILKNSAVGKDKTIILSDLAGLLKKI